MKLKSVLLILFFSLGVLAIRSQPYKDPKLSVAERTENLLSLMTVEEKVGQLLCPLGWEMYDKQGKEVTHSAKFERFVKERNIGMLWATYRADPWTKKTLENGLSPEQAAKVGNALQKYIINNTRLGIPIFLAEEAPHGHMAIGTTVFPSGIGMAATWSADAIEGAGRVIAGEIRAQGAHIGYGPVLDLVRDPRWSRVEETFGEDPVLSGILGAAMVRGTGGGKLNQPASIISTLKHFLAYGVPEGGHNGNAASVGPRDIHENFLPPFKAAIDAGALSVMTSYNSIDGIPCTSNSYLLTDVLRKQWGFKGFVVSDLGSIEGLKGSHHVAATMEEAAVMAVNAGVDSDLGGEAYRNLVDAVKSGRISQSVINTAVARILRLKFEMGLFENPYVDARKARTSVRNDHNIAMAREVARQSLVLLKNDGVLPLSKDVRSVAVIGPNADNIYNMLGDYTAPQDRKNIVTVLDGVKAKLKGATVEYVKGCAIRDTSSAGIQEAVAAVRRSDVSIVVVGGSSARDFKTRYIETGAAVASSEVISDMESGEGYDRATLGLMGRQMDLLKAVKAQGKPLVVVYIQGRPLNMNWASENADALISAWYPGQEGGNAIADVIFGDYNPAGRLPISIPRHEGQIPVHYNRKNPKGHDYVEMPGSPLYSFGYGLSYTSFQYSDLHINQVGSDNFEVSFSVQNIGDRDGDEVVQLYLKSKVSTVVQPLKQLKRFQRVNIKKGDTKKISFTLSHDDFSIINAEMKRVAEPGTFIVEVGSSSDNIKLSDEIVLDYRYGIVEDVFLNDSLPFASVHSATIEETPNGLVAAFFGGKYEGHPEVSIYVTRQINGKWSAPVKVAEGLGDDGRKACYNPVLFMTPDNELLLFYKVGKNVQDWSGYMVRSNDNGQTWSNAEKLPEGILGPVKNRPVMIGGKLVCGSSTEDFGWRVHVEFTADKGKTWTRTEPINDSKWDIIQPSFLIHRDGKLQMVCRSRNEAVVSSFSDDNGQTWSKPFALNLPNNNSGIDAVKLKDGRFLMVMNNVRARESAYIPQKRTPLNVAISSDGLNWSIVSVLEDSPISEYSYPAVIQSSDGMVHIVYTWRREKIKYVKINPDLL